MIVRLLIVWGVIASAIAVAVLVQRKPHKDEDDLPDYRTVLGFVGSAYGMLLGLLVVFAVGHNSDARHQAEAEATSLVALYNTVSAYPRDTRETVQRDLVCYMRSIVADDWPSMERGNSSESPRTGAFGDRVRSDLLALPLTNQRESAAYGRAAAHITDAGKSRQQLLFFTEPAIPTALWVVIYVGVFLLVFLIALHYTANPRGRGVALGSVSLLLTVIVAVLATLDQPFGVGAPVQPREMRQAIELVSEDTRSPILRPCPARPEG